MLERNKIECACGEIITGNIQELMYTEYHISVRDETVYHCPSCGFILTEGSLDNITDLVNSAPFSRDYPYKKLAVTESIWLLFDKNRFYLTTPSIIIGEEYTDFIEIDYLAAKNLIERSGGKHDNNA